MSAVALECQEIVRGAAAPVQPGETIKAQINRSCEALQFPRGHWRVVESWYGRAGCFSAEAYRDLRRRYEHWKDKQDRLAKEEARLHAARLSRISEALSETDENFHRADIDALQHAISQLSGGHRPLDSGAAE